MMINPKVGKVVIPYDKTIICDPETGEVLTEVYDHRKAPKPKSLPKDGKRYVGIDMPYPSECTDKTDMQNAIKAIDANWDYKVEVNDKMIVKLFTEKLLTSKQIGMLVWICENLTGWNYIVTSKKEICENTEVTQNNFSRELKALTKGYLKVVHSDTPERGDIVLKVNPYYAWKGSRYFQRQSLMNWMVGR